MAQDPYARYLQQAEELFSAGEVVRAGQIWQAVLKQVPDHSPARSGLMRVKAALDSRAAEEAAMAAEAAAQAHRRATDSSTEIPALQASLLPAVPATPPAPEVTPIPEVASLPSEPISLATSVPETMDGDTQDKLLREGCTLYDMGQTEDALRKWDQLLSAVPDHPMAIQYAQGARQELGLPLDGSVSVPGQVHPVTQEVPLYSAEEESADKLLREGCLLYDMGLPEEAIGKWNQAIKLAPHRSDIQSFIENAQKDIADEQNAPKPSEPVQAEISPADEKVRQAEHLISMNRFEEAAFSYQQALNTNPGHPGARAGLLRCRAALGSPARSASPSHASGPMRIEMDRPDPVPQEAPPPSEPAQPPAALTKPAPAPRSGLQIRTPEAFDTSNIPDWAKEPKVWIGTVVALVVIISGTLWYRSAARDSRLQSEVMAAHESAVAKAAREAKVPSLLETPATILSEGTQALGEGDAVRAYLRAQTLLKRDPSDGAAAQLLSKAKVAMPSAGLVGATSAEYQRHLQEGDLDQASQVMDALLRANPDDATLRAKALRLYLRLAEDHASQARWSDAQEDLERGRALKPEDPAWSARLSLLGKIQSMPKGDRPLWIALLG